MKIVIIGGTGLVGSQLLTHLRQAGHAVTAASPSTGVDGALTPRQAARIMPTRFDEWLACHLPTAVAA